VVDLSEIAPKLQLAPEGFWISPNVSKVSYEEEHNDICFAVEDQSFWFTYRNECILNAVRLFPPPGAVFDVGGGNGYIAKALQDAGLEVVLVEPGLRGVRNARQRGVSHVVRSTLGDAGFRTGVIPAVGLFDVVEHIEDDRGFLTDLHTYLIPGGRVYLTVPAFRRLWSHEDIVAGHQRRYTVSQICAVLRDSGFEIDYANIALCSTGYTDCLVWSSGISMSMDRASRKRECTRWCWAFFCGVRRKENRWSFTAPAVNAAISFMFAISRRRISPRGRATSTACASM
jgi:SAM-dependent methyltransferase